MEKPQHIIDLESFLKNGPVLSDHIEKELFYRNMTGLKKLHGYIIKNVFNDRHADLQRLQQLQRNLLVWQKKIKQLLAPVRPYTTYYINHHLNKDQEEAIKRLLNIVNGALDDLQLRISHKQQPLDTAIKGITESHAKLLIGKFGKIREDSLKSL